MTLGVVRLVQAENLAPDRPIHLIWNPGGDGILYSFAADKGNNGNPELLWKFDCNPKTTKWVLGGEGTRNNLIATPVAYEGLVYIAVGQDPEHGEGEGHLWCIDPTKRGDISPTLAMKISDDGKRVPIAHKRIQAVEEEWETAGEFYDIFLEDPTDFILRVHLPHICGILEPLKALSPIRHAFGYYLGFLSVLPSFGTTEVARAFEELCSAGAQALEWTNFFQAKSLEVMAMGFPSDPGMSANAPFDTIGDLIRGTHGLMLDIYRRPEKLLAAMEKLVPIMIEMGLRAKDTACPFVGIPLHKGSDGWMSDEQYKTFYWPPLRKVMMGLIDEGLVPVLLFEGENTSRLEIIKDVPKGKAIYWFERVDIRKAKEILGYTVCFRGNVPISLLHAGTPEDVKTYVRELIDVVGENGGLIVDSGCIFDEAKHENVKAMVDCTKEYGVYR